jgi:hypothetical protein
MAWTLSRPRTKSRSLFKTSYIGMLAVTAWHEDGKDSGEEIHRSDNAVTNILKF